MGIGVFLSFYFNPNLNFTLALPFPIENINGYLIVVDAHIDKGNDAGNGGGGIQKDNDAMHIMPKDNAEYITIYAPISGKITNLSYRTILNQKDKPENYCVDISLNVGLGCDVHFSVENYSNDPNVQALQKELMFIKKGTTVKKGDKLFTFVSAGIGAHVCYSIFTNTSRYHPFDFMLKEDINICHSIKTEKPPLV